MVVFKLFRGQSVRAQDLNVTFFVEAAGDLERRNLRDDIHQLVIGYSEPESARFLKREPLLNEIFQQRAFNVQALQHFRSERALQKLPIPIHRSLIMLGKFRLRDGFAIHLREVLQL